ncbi:CBU_0592 family membrane protein [Belliella marina]|uniref:CBU_0592 family membrane protein n=1 Tax=Belliella marina TaxID=1644146 RepID=UPI003A938D53
MFYMLIGWVGAILFITSYFMLSIGKLRQEGKYYHLLNLCGAICLVVNAIHFNDNANILVNIVWAAIALMALYQVAKASFRSKS